MSALLLQTKGFGVERGGRVLFHELALDVVRGSITVVIGPNGAGKSSLLLALAGVIAHSGDCLLQGRNHRAVDRNEMSRQIAWQGELPPTEFGLTVAERLDLAAGAFGASNRAHAVEAMELEALLHRTLGELSSGERQRVEIAAVMVRDCPLWFFDEPTAHLDLKHQQRVLKLLRDAAAEGRTIVTVLHDLQQASAVADQVVLLDGHGGAEAGEAAGLLTSERLSNLFQVKLQSIHNDGHSLLLPDYRS